MSSKLMNWINGHVTIQLEGGDNAKFINLALMQQLNIASLHWTSQNHLQFTIEVKHFYKLRKVVKQCGCRLRIINKQGFPFFMKIVLKRIWFSIGITMFFSIIMALSMLVWKIEVEGNKTIPKDEILAAAKELGLYTMQWSFRLEDADKLSKQLVSAIPGTNWVGVEKTGTKVKIQIVEMTVPEERVKQSPRHLIASTDAVISYIVAETGKPMVKKNMKVRKGDILISGVIGSSRHSQVVIASGKVKGIVWYEYKTENALSQTYKALTGERKSTNYLVLGNRAMKIAENSQEEYELSEVSTYIKRPKLGSITLPFGIMQEIEQEARIITRELTKEESKYYSLKQARHEILAKAGEDAEIISEIILHEELRNGKVVLNVLFEVEQSITKEMPIVQMQGD